MERIDIDGPDVDYDESQLLLYRGEYFTGEAVELFPDGRLWTLKTFANGFEDGPTRQELDEAKSYIKGSQMLALDTSSKLASALLQYQLDKLPIDYIEKRNAIVDAVTLDDARNAAKRLWGKGLVTVIVGRAPQAAAQPAAAAPPTAN